MKSIPLARLLAFTALTVSLSSCLKTRAVMKDEADDSKNESAAAAPPQGGYAIDELKGEITRLNGRIEDLERSRNSTANNTPSSEDLKKLETRIIELEQAQLNLIESFKKLQDERKPDPTELLHSAGQKYEEGDYAGAIKSAESYLKAGGTSEDAYLILGESNFKLRQFKKSITAYASIQEKFPKSPKVPKALRQIALGFESLAMDSDARAFWEQLAEQYPKTPEGREALKKIGHKKSR